MYKLRKKDVDVQAIKKKCYKLKRDTRKVEFGWLHYINGQYRQVRQKQGGGTREVSVKRDTTKTGLIEKGKELFFPNGMSQHGKLVNMECDLFDFQRNAFDRKSTVQHIFNTTGFTRLRFYLASKQIEGNIPATITSGDYDNKSSSSADAGNSIRKNKHSEYINSSSDSESQKETRKTRSQADNNTINSSKRKKSEKYYISSGSENEEDTLLSQKTEDKIRSSTYETLVQELFPDAYVCEIAESNIFDYGELQAETQDPVELVTPETTQSAIPVPVESAATDAINLIDDICETKSPTIKLHRGHVMGELQEYFLSHKIVNKINVKMILPNGVEEAGMDQGGVVRDALSEFWNDFYDCYTLGTQAKIPIIRHDYDYERWKSVARCLLWGWRFENYFPIKLALPFLEQCFYGKVSCNLVEWFFQYVSEGEAKLLKAAISTFHMVDQDELMEVLSTFECRILPSEENVHQLVADIAHKELVQRSMFIIDAWREILTNIVDIEELPGILKKREAVAQNILPLLRGTCNDDEERKCFGFLKKFIREADGKILSSLLRFSTGADIIITDKLFVEFNRQTGFTRAPSGHTCAFTLELSKTYDTYPEFRNELRNVLESKIWVMDAI